jgi:hypothetical protein
MVRYTVWHTAFQRNGFNLPFKWWLVPTTHGDKVTIWTVPIMFKYW